MRIPPAIQISVLLFALITNVLLAEWRASAGQVFRSENRTVRLFATVRAKDGRLVPNLPQDAFRVFDDGVPVEISLFSNAPQPITAVLLLDMSDSILDKGRLIAGVKLFLRTLQPADRIRLGSFGVEIALGHDLTNDPVILQRVLDEEMWFGGSTPLWRALDAGLSSLKGETGRRVVMVLTDGEDSPDAKLVPQLSGGFGAVKKHVQVNPDTMIYAVNLIDKAQGLRLSGHIVALTELSGGGHVNVPLGADLGSAFAEIGDELRHQYLLGFLTSKNDDKPHKISVEIAPRGMAVKARREYQAAGPGGSEKR